MKKLYIDIHAIQTVPPSNINRDDTGSPKTAQYGGVTRARVSSQAWKKAIRDYFNHNGMKGNVGIRSLNVIQYVADEIQKIDPEISKEESLKRAVKTFEAAGVKTANNQVKALFFISSKQAFKLAQAAVEGKSDKKQLLTILREDPAVDIALFGRMVADEPSLNEEASSQVAHAISTHPVQTEFDFYTATDDLANEDNSGAGMLGTVEFNASTLYRYANVNVHDLKVQLKDDAEATITALKLFIEAFSNSMPTGKANSFANQTLPQAVLITGRSDRPVNLVSAFEAPVKPDLGYVQGSIDKLDEEFKKVQKFVDQPEFTLSIGFNNLGESQESLKSMLDRFEEIIHQFIAAE